jgi:hypothetical protein
MIHGFKKVVTEKGAELGRPQGDNLGGVQGRTQRRSIRTKRILEAVANCKSRIMGAATRAGSNNTGQRYLNFSRLGREDCQYSQDRASHNRQADQTTNQTCGPTPEESPQNLERLQTRKVNSKRSDTFFILCQSPFKQQKRRFGRFSCFFLVQIAAKMTFWLANRPLTPDTTGEISNQTLPIPLSGTFDAARGQIEAFLRKIRACLNLTIQNQ